MHGNLNSAIATYNQELEERVAAWARAKIAPNRLGHVEGVVETCETLARRYAPDDVARARLAGLQVVDVRNPDEWRSGTIPGAIGIPLPELRERLGELDPAAETLVYCAGGQRSAFAARILAQRGFARVHSLSGGFRAWQLFAAARARAGAPEDAATSPTPRDRRP